MSESDRPRFLEQAWLKNVIEHGRQEIAKFEADHEWREWLPRRMLTR